MGKLKVLVVNCYSDNNRGARGNPFFVPQSIAALSLAGAFSNEHCELRVACEFRSGPFEDLKALAWPQLLVLTGLNAALDRMKQLCAYAKTLNPGVTVVVGGPLARVLPRYCSRFFDVVLDGDAEALAELAASLYGPEHRAEPVRPRYELAPSWHPVGYAEASRNCNFACDFCSMTAEGRPHQTLPLEHVRAQLERLQGKQCVMFLDQNFFAGPRQHLQERLDLLAEFHDAGRIGGWAALVTSDFFAKPEWMDKARASGCIGFFSGVESLDDDQLRSYAKKQNLQLPGTERMRRCLAAGMTFHYGLIYDPLQRRARALRDEVEAIAADPTLTLPSFVSLAIPLLGTPMFRRQLEQGVLLPGLKLRDMDGRSLLTQSLDGPDELMPLLAEMDHCLVSPAQARRHAFGLWRHYRKILPRRALVSALSADVGCLLRRFSTATRDAHLGASATRRSHFGPSERLGTLYQPRIALAESYRGHFEATAVTDGAGELHPDLWSDLGNRPAVLQPVQLLTEVRRPPALLRD
ncbi:radical SAM protein [Pelomonas sp. SE-A7]|uniref:B12-binding domain-containing radical SAM protein n=1 Tax=Pelomonas sp. SE-A7 TaxID=3054953 RepID=UPI00259D0ECB|nr:radical SAM protein [Pelomonas sp. SE-A7]MDM4768074.1 radical SAM protein [Pelomonas sp. SE-A7]